MTLQKKEYSRLQDDLERLASDPGLDAEIKVTVHQIDTGLHAQVNGDQTGWAASIIKVPVLVAAAREISEERLHLDEKIRIDHRFTLDPTDSISRLPEGTPVRVAELLEFMIVASDNEATNVLANRLGIQNINEHMWVLGLNRTMLGHLLCSNVPLSQTYTNLLTG